MQAAAFTKRQLHNLERLSLHLIPTLFITSESDRSPESQPVEPLLKQSRGKNIPSEKTPTGLPHGVLVSGRQAGVGDRGTVGRTHHALRKQEVAEQAGHQQILSEQPLEQLCGER